MKKLMLLFVIALKRVNKVRCARETMTFARFHTHIYVFQIRRLLTHSIHLSDIYYPWKILNMRNKKRHLFILFHLRALGIKLTSACPIQSKRGGK